MPRISSSRRPPKANDYPLAECTRAALDLMHRGWDIHQKFTCVACGERQTIEEPNIFFTSATCSECGAVTDIAKNGCNYAAVKAFGPP